MKILFINRSDSLGGAAVVTRRLMEALREQGHEADMLVLHRAEKSRGVHKLPGGFRARLPFLLERLQIFLGNGRNRADLFKADTASFGLPLHRDPLLQEADVICLAWINQGMLSLSEIERIASLGKPLFWVMHDMWPMTGICHHAADCEGFKEQCGLCPLLGRKASLHDLSRKVWRSKKKLFAALREQGRPITFIAVSHWLQGRARASSLLGGERVEVIPNPFPPVAVRPAHKEQGRINLVIAAARLDDPIKGLPILIDACARLRLDAPQVASRLYFTAIGALKDPHALDAFPLPLEQTGALTREQTDAHMRRAHIVVSSSLYETLPGTLVEGQAAGALPVAFDRGGQRDIITDGLTGILAPFGQDPAACLASALERAVAMIDATPSAELQQRLMNSVNTRFAAPAIATRFLDLFRSVAEKA